MSGDLMEQEERDNRCCQKDGGEASVRSGRVVGAAEPSKVLAEWCRLLRKY